MFSMLDSNYQETKHLCHKPRKPSWETLSLKISGHSFVSFKEACLCHAFFQGTRINPRTWNVSIRCTALPDWNNISEHVKSSLPTDTRFTSSDSLQCDPKIFVPAMQQFVSCPFRADELKQLMTLATRHDDAKQVCVCYSF